MIKQFKALPEGIKRAIIAGSIIIAVIVPFILGADPDHDLNDEDFWEPFIWSFIFYWILTVIGIWIYSGFKSNNNEH